MLLIVFLLDFSHTNVFKLFIAISKKPKKKDIKLILH